MVAESSTVDASGDVRFVTLFLKVDKNLVKIVKERMSNLIGMVDATPGFIEVKASRQTARK
jgi:hypothetical protein